MKICMISYLSHPPYTGGAEIFVDEISKRLTVDGHTIYLVTSKPDSTLPRYENRKSTRIFRVGNSILPGFSYLINGVQTVLNLNKKHNFDIIHAHMGIPSYAGLIGAFSGKIMGKPVILSFQGGRAWVMNRYIFRPFSKYMFSSSTVVHTVSTYLSEIAKRFGGKNIVRIPNGVDLTTFKPEYNLKEIINIKKNLGISDQNKILITVSRIDEKNGILDLIRAIKGVVVKDQDVKLLIVGDGPLRSTVEKEIRTLNLENYVIIVGNRRHEEIPNFLALADVFIRPSLSEGFGISFIEAMACGVPVIGSCVGGIPDFLYNNKTGLLVHPGEINDISQAIFKVLNDLHLAKELSKNAYNMVVKRYAWENIVKDIRNLYIFAMKLNSSKREVRFL